MTATTAPKSSQIRDTREKAILLLTEESGNVIGRFDADGTVRHVTGSAQALLGYQPDEMIGRSSLDFVIPPHRDRMREIIARLAGQRNGLPERADFQALRRDGTSVWVETTARAIRDPQTGALLEIVSLSRDISARKATEEALRESEERFRSIFEAGILGMLFLRADKTILDVNDTFAQMLGYARDELRNRPLADITHPDDIGKDHEALARMSQGGPREYRTEKRYLRKDGAIVWARVTATGMHDKEGSFLYGFGIVEDITRLRQQQEALKASEARFGTLVKNAPGYIAILDRDHRMVFVNRIPPGMAQNEDEVLGTRPYDAVDPAQREALRQQYDEVLATGTPHSYELPFRSPTGERGWIQSTAAPIVGGGESEAIVVMSHEITDRKLAEQALQESEQRYRMMVEEVRDYAIFMLDPEGRVCTWSKGAARIKGYEARDILGRSFKVFYTPEDLAAEKPARLLEIAAREGRVEDEGWRARKDGTRFWADVIVTALRDSDGRLRGFGKVTRDLSERRVLEQERGRLAAIVSSSNDAIIATTTEGVITTWNRGAERMYGYTAAEIVGQPVLRITPAERHAELSALIRRVSGGEGVVALETRRVGKGGRVLDVSLTLSPVWDGAGTVIAISGVSRDISARKSAEARAERQAQMLDAANDTIVVRDMADRIQSWNQGAERLYGWSRAEATGQVAAELLHSAFRGKTGEPLDTCLARGRWEGEVLQRRRDGSTVVVSSRWTLMRDEGGAPAGILEISNDVTERLEAERQERLARDRLLEIQHLKEVDQFKTQLLNAASHELNTPLTALQLQLELLKKLSTGGGARQQQALAVLDRNVDRLALLVRDILDVARLQGGHLVLDRRRMDLQPVLAQALTTFEGQALRQGIQIETNFSSAPKVDGDARRIGQVLHALLSNALKFTPPGGRIGVFLGERSGDAEIRIQDSGRGLTPDQIPRLFQPFSQILDARVHPPGPGLGLYISKGIVEAHGGRIWAESTGSGHGATFGFTLPSTT